MLDAILEYAITGKIPSVFIEEENRIKKKRNIVSLGLINLPKRMTDSHLNRHSKVLEFPDSDILYRPLPSCPISILATPEPLNETAPV
jgi:hypothetical protein